MKRSNCVPSFLATALLLLLPSCTVAVDVVESFLRAGAASGVAKRSRTAPNNRELFFDSSQQKSCPATLKTCRGTHRPGSINYEAMIGFLDKMNPSPEGAVSQFRVILESAAGFSGDSFQPDVTLSEEAADRLETLVPTVVDGIHKQEQLLKDFQDKKKGDIEENGIDFVVEVVMTVDVFIQGVVAEVSTVVPIVGDIANFFNTINDFFTNNLLMPLLTDNIVIALLAATFALNAGLIAAFYFADSEYDYEYEYYGRRKLEQSMGCIADLVSCQIEGFIAENSAGMLETALMADASAVP